MVCCFGLLALGGWSVAVRGFWFALVVFGWIGGFRVLLIRGFALWVLVGVIWCFCCFGLVMVPLVVFTLVVG